LTTRLDKQVGKHAKVKGGQARAPPLITEITTKYHLYLMDSLTTNFHTTHSSFKVDQAYIACRCLGLPTSSSCQFIQLSGMLNLGYVQPRVVLKWLKSPELILLAVSNSCTQRVLCILIIFYAWSDMNKFRTYCHVGQGPLMPTVEDFLS
jgi:hypothetical protein